MLNFFNFQVPRTRQAPNRISKSQASSIPVVCIDLDESDPVDLSPQTSQMSRAPCVQSSSSESIISRAPSTSSALPATIRGTAHQVGSTHPMMQHQPPHPAQTVPYFPGSAVPLVPPPNTGMPGTSAANFFNPFEQTPYPSYYQQEFNTRLIAEELRQFMANIQHSTSPPAFPRYSWPTALNFDWRRSSDCFKTFLERSVFSFLALLRIGFVRSNSKSWPSHSRTCLYYFLSLCVCMSLTSYLTKNRIKKGSCYGLKEGHPEIFCY